MNQYEASDRNAKLHDYRLYMLYNIYSCSCGIYISIYITILLLCLFMPFGTKTRE